MTLTPLPSRDPEPPPPPHPVREPLVNLPAVTQGLVLAMVGIHALLFLLCDDATILDVFYTYGFVPAHYSAGPAERPAGLALLLPPLSYMFLHGGWTHLFVNAASLAAFGAGVERWMGRTRFLALFILSGLAAAAVQFFSMPDSAVPVVGASGAVSGLFAAVMILLRDTTGLNTGRWGLWPLLGLWVALTVVTGLIGGPDGSAVAWQAHIGGFISGFVLVPILRRL